MAEICLDCLNKLNNTNKPAERYIISKDLALCEECGEMKHIIIRERSHRKAEPRKASHGLHLNGGKRIYLITDFAALVFLRIKYTFLLLKESITAHKYSRFADNNREVIKMQLTQKETSLLKDLKNEEKLCVDKYTAYSETARDPQLKNLFSQIAKTEQQHLNTIEQMEKGTAPAPSAGAQPQPSFTAAYSLADTEDKKHDCFLCSDLLNTEKHASHLYDTCIFEFTQESYRMALNHIQKEEQNHGKMIYDYMTKNSMYS